MPNNKRFLSKFKEVHSEKCSRCVIKEKHTHCRLCNFAHKEDFKMNRHLQQTHLNLKYITEAFDMYFIYFKLEHCQNTNIHKRYYCPKCHRVVAQLQYFINHIRLHIDPTSTDKSQSNASKPKVTVDEQTLHKPSKKDVMKECSICNKSIHKNSLKRHITSIHKQIVIPRAFCVDKINGIFLVKRSNHGGVPHFIHVQKLLHGNATKLLDCKDQQCLIRMRAAALGNVSALECKHMKIIDDSTAYPEEITLTETSLRQLSSEGTYKLLTSKTIENCLQKNSSSALARSLSSNGCCVR